MNLRNKIMLTVLCVISIFYLVSKYGQNTGKYNLFKSDSFHYQTLRTLGHSMYQGSAPGEVLAVISRINDENEEEWYAEWNNMGKTCEEWGRKSVDSVTGGNAYLRASNYYRTGEFFLSPEDERKVIIYNRSVIAFQKALVELGIKHSIYNIPYEKGRMTAYYFKGDRDKPLIIICGGFDSTNEESYFWLGKPLIDRGYSVAMFEGPGQSGMIRNYNIKFTPDWHKPVGKVIDFLCSKDQSIIERKKILAGISLGGILTCRAAAFESRIDGTVLLGSPFDFQDSALFQLPYIARKMFYNGYSKLFNYLAYMKRRVSITSRWGLNNGMNSIGGKTPYDFLVTGGKFTLKDVHEKVRCPVAVFYGEKDLFVSDGIQDVMFKGAFKNAKNYTLKSFPIADGASEHCQAGTIEQSVMEFIKWMKDQGFVK